jgi:methyltransferase-like protein/SAM-dependent methyltransferase
MLTQELPITSYDAFPYPKMAFAQTHPARLATIGRLFGLNPAPVHQARVLEFGCASGTNLLGMAEQMPQSEFVGVDMSGVQIAEAQRTAKTIGLTNVRFLQQDIATLGDEIGRFDYVLCHGVFSWVPPHVQDAILDVCRRQLQPHGIAYISYNTHPGWRMRSAIRDMMLYYSKKFEGPRQQLHHANELLKFLAANAPARQPFGAFLKAEVEALQHHSKGYLYHEYLETVNNPVYFHEFVDHAARFQLQYLGEAHMASMWSEHLPKHVAKTFEKMSSNLIQMEQLSDFLKNRMFRQTLLCRSEATIDRSLGTAKLRDLYVTSPLVSEPTQANDGKMAFRHRKSKRGLMTRTPVTAAALAELQQMWPQGVRFTDLAARAIARAGGAGLTRDAFATLENGLARTFLEGYLRNTIELSTVAGPFVVELSERPLASPLARLQAAGNEQVTNRRQEAVTLCPIARRLIGLLDGTRTREEFHLAAQEILAEVELPAADEASETDQATRISMVANNALLSFAHNALLVR